MTPTPVINATVQMARNKGKALQDLLDQGFIKWKDQTPTTIVMGDAGTLTIEGERVWLVAKWEGPEDGVAEIGGNTPEGLKLIQELPWGLTKVEGTGPRGGNLYKRTK